MDGVKDIDWAESPCGRLGQLPGLDDSVPGQQKPASVPNHRIVDVLFDSAVAIVVFSWAPECSVETRRPPEITHDEVELVWSLSQVGFGGTVSQISLGHDMACISYRLGDPRLCINAEYVQRASPRETGEKEDHLPSLRTSIPKRFGLTD